MSRSQGTNTLDCVSTTGIGAGRQSPRLEGLARREIVAVAAVLGLGAILRFSTLGLQSFWYDEAVTVHRVLHPDLWSTLSTIPNSESNPPLYYVLIWLWTKLFGTGAVGIRSFSALVGTLMIPVVWATARSWFGSGAALIAAALVACNPFLIWYSQEARPYALVGLLGACSFYWFVRCLEEPGARPAVAWGVFSSLTIMTHYFAAFLIAGEVIWMLLRARERVTIGASAAIGAVGLALVPLAAHQASTGHTNWIGAIPFSQRIIAIPERFLMGETGYRERSLLVVAAISMIVVGIAALRLTGRSRSRVAALGVLAAASLVLPIVLALGGADFVWPRNLLVSLLPVFVIAGAALASLPSRALQIAVPAVTCVVFVGGVLAVDLRPRLQRAAWSSAAADLGRARGPRAIVVPFIGDEPMMLYARAGYMPRTGRKVREIDLVGWYIQGTKIPTSPAVGFRLVGKTRTHLLTVVRYRATRPRLVNWHLAQHGVGTLQMKVLTAG